MPSTVTPYSIAACIKATAHLNTLSKRLGKHISLKHLFILYLAATNPPKTSVNGMNRLLRANAGKGMMHQRLFDDMTMLTNMGMLIKTNTKRQSNREPRTWYAISIQGKAFLMMQEKAIRKRTLHKLTHIEYRRLWVAEYRKTKKNSDQS